VEIKGQLRLDATDWFLLQNLQLAQHVSGTIVPIIRSSRYIQTVAACGNWRFGLDVDGLVWSCGLCVRFAGCLAAGAARVNLPQNRGYSGVILNMILIYLRFLHNLGNYLTK